MSNQNDRNSIDDSLLNISLDLKNLDINNIFGSDIKNNANEETKKYQENTTIKKSNKKEKIINSRLSI